LAIVAGFKSCAADKIAGADQGVDDNPKTDPWKSKRNRELWHFPSQERVNEVINAAKESCSLVDLGMALHVLQDSYSHAGYPAWRGHFPDWSVDDPKSDPVKYNNMTEATKKLLNEFKQKCGIDYCK